MNYLKYSVIVGTLIGLGACSSSKSESKPAKKEAATESAAATAEIKNNAKPGGETPREEADDERTDPKHMEAIPNATSTVKARDFKGKLPDDFDKEQLNGDFHGIIGWTDKYGLQAVVFSLSVSEKEGEDGEDPATSAVLLADFVLWEGDAWTSQRQFKAALKDCMFDAEIGAKSGPWSVTDLDSNGLAEISFAWSVGCRSDVSPIKHKVFLVGFDEHAAVQKHVLRGTTGIELEGSIDEGGEFKADELFQTAPKSFLAHATKVWKETSVEKPY
jgi:hypothetical protein